MQRELTGQLSQNALRLISSNVIDTVISGEFNWQHAVWTDVQCVSMNAALCNVALGDFCSILQCNTEMSCFNHSLSDVSCCFRSDATTWMYIRKACFRERLFSYNLIHLDQFINQNCMINKIYVMLLGEKLGLYLLACTQTKQKSASLVLACDKLK